MATVEIFCVKCYKFNRQRFKYYEVGIFIIDIVFIYTIYTTRWNMERKLLHKVQ
jgi:hypothetical protein